MFRVCSMCMIVSCHCAGYLGLSWLAQFLNVGVYNFLLMSGWLYGQKAIVDYPKWMLNRWKKLCIPVLAWLGMVVVYALIVDHSFPQIGDVVLFLTNLQGLSWVLPFFPSIHSEGALGGLGNLWFVTVIMLCYLLLIAVKELEKRKIKWDRIQYDVFGIICLFVAGCFRINLSYFMIFLLGCCLGKAEYNPTARHYVGFSVAMLAAIGLRLIAKHFIDGTDVYEGVVVGVTHSVIAVWIFYTVRLMDQKSGFVHAVAASIPMRYLDGISYYIYITHYFFLVKRFGLREMVSGIGMQMLVFCMLTIVTSLLVKWLSERMLGKLA